MEAIAVGGMFTLVNVLLLLVLNNMHKEIRHLRTAKHTHNNYFIVIDDRLREIERGLGLDVRSIYERERDRERERSTDVEP